MCSALHRKHNRTRRGRLSSPGRTSLGNRRHRRARSAIARTPEVQREERWVCLEHACQRLGALRVDLVVLQGAQRTAGSLSGNVECSLQAGEHGGRLRPSLNTLYAQQLGHLFDPAPCLTGNWSSAKTSNANNIGPTSAPACPLGQRSATCLQLQDGDDAARV